MLYYLFYPLREYFFIFNVFRYITFRAAFASITAFLITVIFAPPLIERLRLMKVGETIRKRHCPELYRLHKDKTGTPTMGGVLMLLGIVSSVVLWADIKNPLIVLSLVVTVFLGTVGFIDDYKKLRHADAPRRGISKRTKLLAQLFIGIIIGIYIYVSHDIDTTLEVPFFKKLAVDIGIFYIPFAMLVLTASSNAVNLTDGLDGLATGCIILVAVAYAGMSYITGHAVFSNYLGVYHLSEAAELTIFCAAIAGSGLGFLWFNCFPASIFMGDTGALALGGAIGTISIFIKKEIMLILVGGIFVAEALSVLLQVLSFRLGGKRIFKIAPLHHHFEMCGWPEPKVTVRLWIIAVILLLLSFATLKLR